MPERSETPSPQGSAGALRRSQRLAETVIDSLGRRLLREAERCGGWLSADDLGRIIEDLEARAESLQAAFERSFEDYVRARERAALNQQRDFPFDRQLVALFHHLFPGPGGPGLDGGAISRRMLPGFFMAVSLMLGPEIVEDYQNRCRGIVEDLRHKHGTDFPWETVYNDPRMNDVVFDALVAMSDYFAEPEHRLQWLLRVINEHLGPPQIDREGTASRGWQLTERDLCRVLDALFSGVRAALQSDIGKLRLTKAYGGDGVAKLWDVLHVLDARIAPAGGPVPASRAS